MKKLQENKEYFSDIFKQFKKDKLSHRKRFYLNDLKNYIIKKVNGVEAYSKIEGYKTLYKLLKDKEKADEIRAIKSSSLNDRNPPLKKRWELVKDKKEKWDKREIFCLSSKLDLSYYLKRPDLQNTKLLEKLKKVYLFLKEKDEREWASREERSLELFDDEKFLSRKEGRRFLRRLKLSLADLKAEKYSQMFVYWKNNIKIKKVLILENHSIFISCKRALSDDIPLFSFSPDTLIYGSGKHIVKSLSFLKEIADINEVEIYYVGDIDPAGFSIYHFLKEKYEDFNLQLFKEFYREMIKRGNKGYEIKTEQNKNKVVLDTILKEFKVKKDKNFRETIKYLWENNLRIPQEVITYEVLKGEYNI